jgi:hypothetical protein
MSPPDNYDNLELDSAVLHELALIEATLATSKSGPVDQSPSKLSNSDSDHIHPTEETPGSESLF